MLHLQEQLGLHRKQAKFAPLKNYERTWDRIVQVLRQDDYGLVPQEIERPLRSRKERVQQMMKLYTPLNLIEVAQGDTLRSYESAKLGVGFSAGTKPLLRRETDCVTELIFEESERQAYRQTIPARPISAAVPMRRPLSSFQKSKQQQQPLRQLSKPVQVQTTSQLPPHQQLRSVVKSQSQRNHQRPFVPPANMTAYAYVVMELPQSFHITWNSQTQLEMASLTKIMTCIVVLRLLREFNGDIEQTVEVGSIETSITGTSAELERGFRYSIEQLLYGLMLPSGNDASLALAVWGGKAIFCREKKLDLESIDTDVSINNIKKREAISLFVREMNRVAHEIGLKRTSYTNPHGLSNPDNKSTANDIAVLCRHAIQDQQFKKIVSCKKYRSTATNRLGECLKIEWDNTNKLLHKKQYSGLKTGYTSTAGSCLASHILIDDREFIVVVLKCKKLDRRFKETEILKRWVMRKEGLRLRHAPNDGLETQEPELETMEDIEL